MLDTARLAVDVNHDSHCEVTNGAPLELSLSGGRSLPAVDPPFSFAHAAIIGNFPPRQCGIATFTRDTLESLKGVSPATRWKVAAVTDTGAHYDYPADVTQVIAQNEPDSYVSLAEDLNNAGVQVAFIQHEFGIFGGPAGDYLLMLMRRLRMPIITTLHTILERPDADQRRVMDEIIRLSSAIIVMTEKGADILEAVYDTGPSKAHVIPHGAPRRPLAATDPLKAALGFAGKKVIMTFGLLSPNKGLETIIRAMPRVLEQHPDALYLIVGASHPHLVAREGEAYRDGLVELSKELGVDHALHFINRFVDNPQLFDLLQAADIYVTPYLSEAQIVSGTLSYAIALGKPVVSTPYWHAVEALADGVGVICPFNDVDAFAHEITSLLSDDQRRLTMARKAWRQGAASHWPSVGQASLDLAIASQTSCPRKDELPLISLARPKLDAVRRLSDDVGIFQHAKYRVPDRAHGYCTDDTARALTLMAHLARQDIDTPTATALSYVFASFLDAAWNPEMGRFRNFMSWDRRWLDDGGCDDCNGRAFEAICLTAVHGATADLRDWATDLARRVYQHSHRWTSLRSRAHVMKASIAAEGVVLDPREVETTLEATASMMLGTLDASGAWFEPGLSYDNARLPEALILAGERLRDERMIAAGLTALSWLMARQTAPTGHFRPMPTSGFADSAASHAAFDQQPIEAWASIDACVVALTLTGDDSWRDHAIRAFSWFTGENDLGLPLVTVEDGGCFDGLTARGCNQNQGAESVLSYQLSAVAMRQVLPSA